MAVIIVLISNSSLNIQKQFSFRKKTVQLLNVIIIIVIIDFHDLCKRFIVGLFIEYRPKWKKLRCARA